MCSIYLIEPNIATTIPFQTWSKLSKIDSPDLVANNLRIRRLAPQTPLIILAKSSLNITGTP